MKCTQMINFNSLNLLLIFVVSSLFSLTGKCQDYEAYLINLNHDTVRCELKFKKHRNPFYMYRNEYFSQPQLSVFIKDEEYLANPKDWISLHVKFYKKWEKFHAVPTDKKYGYRFAKKLVDGKMSLYSFLAPTIGIINATEKFYVLVDEEKQTHLFFTETDNAKSRSKAIDFFEHCEIIQEQIYINTVPSIFIMDWKALIERHNKECK